MSLPKSTPYQNGQTPASPDLGEAFVSTQNLSAASLPIVDSGESQPKVSPSRQTVFPVDPPTPSIRTTFYGFTHYYFGGVTLFRWFIVFIVGATLVSIVAGPLPWIANIIIGMILIVGMIIWRRVLQREDFVRFEPKELPAALQQLGTADSGSFEAKLDPADKIPVHVTGLFAVEGIEERFTWVPGFYRTFSTREHALLCQVKAQRFLKVAEFDEAQTGMWYIFFEPSEITDMRWGTLYFGSKPKSAIAVDRKHEINTTSRFKRDKIQIETIYIAFQDLEDGHRIWADLTIDSA